MSVENLLGIPHKQVLCRAIFIQRVIGYSSKGGENRSPELRINVRREFIAYPSKAVQVSDSLYTKPYPSKGGEK
jgi:hypothetical protein